MVSSIFGHHPDDQECKECPNTGVLEDVGCLDGGYVIVTQYIIPSWSH